MELKNKVVLITGAARRIGREIALTLANAGASILIHYNRSEKDALALKREINQLGCRAWLIQADFSSRGKAVDPIIRRFLARAYRLTQRVDVLINNASIYYPTPVTRMKERQWDDFLTVNLKVPVLLARAVGLKMLRQKSGKIINLIDWSVFRPRKDYLPYTVSKAGLLNATAALAKEFAPDVQVLGVAPGPILPPSGVAGQSKKSIIEKTLLKRFGHPRDIAETVKFLIQGSDYLTGTCVPVDGGALVN